MFCHTNTKIPKAVAYHEPTAMIGHITVMIGHTTVMIGHTTVMIGHTTEELIGHMTEG